MYLWQRRAGPRWWNENEEALRTEAGLNLAVIQQPPRKQLTIEIACRSPIQAKKIRRRFDGSVRKLPHDWLKRLARVEKTKPLRIGKRLLISNGRRVMSASGRSRLQRPCHIFIPAGAAFGTGQHVTTAMTLRLLEELTRSWAAGWSMIDLGTGTGILALAARRLGSKRVSGIDNDPVAISTARENARSNKISGVDFKAADLRGWKIAASVDVVTANLFSELLIQVLPAIAGAHWLIASGVLASQENQVARALRQNAFRIVKVRRRGKWIALLASKREHPPVVT